MRASAEQVQGGGKLLPVQSWITYVCSLGTGEHDRTQALEKMGWHSGTEACWKGLSLRREALTFHLLAQE